MTKSIFFYSIKNEVQETLSLGVPLIASQLIYACSGFIGTALVAQLGEAALAASVLVSMVWMSLSVLFFGILNSVSVLVSHQYGAKNDQAISEIMGKSFLLGLLVCLIMISVLIFMPLFLQWSTQPPIVLTLAKEYMHAMLWQIPALILLIICEQFLAGINRAKIVLRISMVVVPIEIPLIYVLIFGKFGFPQCGIAGVGYGFAVTYTLTAIWLVVYLLKSNYYKRFGIFKGINTVNLKYLKELINVGLPMGLMHVIEVSTFALATFWIARFGMTFLAAHQIVLQYLGFVITLVFAMSQAVTVRVGHAVGRNDLSRIRYAVYVGMILSFLCVLIVSLAFYFVPTFFLRLDLNIHEVKNLSLIHDASLLLSICGVLLLFDNFRIIGFGALRGLKDTKFPMYASFFAFWIIGLSFSYLLGFNYGFGGAGIWWGLTFGIMSGAAIVFIRLQKLLAKMDAMKIIGLSNFH